MSARESLRPDILGKVKFQKLEVKTLISNVITEDVLIDGTIYCDLIEAKSGLIVDGKTEMKDDLTVTDIAFSGNSHSITVIISDIENSISNINVSSYWIESGDDSTIYPQEGRKVAIGKETALFELDVNGSANCYSMTTSYLSPISSSITLTGNLTTTHNISAGKITTGTITNVESSIITYSSHENLTNVYEVGETVENGHISNTTQSIYGEKTMKGITSFDEGITSSSNLELTATGNVQTQGNLWIKRGTIQPNVSIDNVATLYIFSEIVSGGGNQGNIGCISFASSDLIDESAQTSYKTAMIVCNADEDFTPNSTASHLEIWTTRPEEYDSPRKSMTIDKNGYTRFHGLVDDTTSFIISHETANSTLMKMDATEIIELTPTKINLKQNTEITGNLTATSMITGNLTATSMGVEEILIDEKFKLHYDNTYTRFEIENLTTSQPQLTIDDEGIYFSSNTGVNMGGFMLDGLDFRNGTGGISHNISSSDLYVYSILDTMNFLIGQNTTDVQLSITNLSATFSHDVIITDNLTVNSIQLTTTEGQDMIRTSSDKLTLSTIGGAWIDLYTSGNAHYLATTHIFKDFDHTPEYLTINASGSTFLQNVNITISEVDIVKFTGDDVVITKPLKLENNKGLLIARSGSQNTNIAGHSSIQLGTTTYFGEGATYDEHTGICIYSTMPSGWGTSDFRIKTSSGWGVFEPSETALIVSNDKTTIRYDCDIGNDCNISGDLIVGSSFPICINMVFEGSVDTSPSGAAIIQHVGSNHIWDFKFKNTVDVENSYFEGIIGFDSFASQNITLTAKIQKSSDSSNIASYSTEEFDVGVSFNNKLTPRFTYDSGTNLVADTEYMVVFYSTNTLAGSELVLTSFFKTTF